MLNQDIHTHRVHLDMEVQINDGDRERVIRTVANAFQGMGFRPDPGIEPFRIGKVMQATGPAPEPDIGPVVEDRSQFTAPRAQGFYESTILNMLMLIRAGNHEAAHHVGRTALAAVGGLDIYMDEDREEMMKPLTEDAGQV